ncbi:MAG: hypothetical protein ACYC1Z_05575 [Georgenia sp.]
MAHDERYEPPGQGEARWPRRRSGGVVSRCAAATDPLVLAPHLRNDLQGAALELRPEQGDVLAAADRAGALAAIVSGTGPTVAALALDAAHAISVADVVRAADVAAEVLTVTGPVAGVRVLEQVNVR